MAISDTPTQFDVLASSIAHLAGAVRDIQDAIKKLREANDVERNTSDSTQAAPAPTGNLTAQAAAESPSTPTLLEEIGTTSVEDPEGPQTEEPHRWYAVIVGREPGVFCSTSHDVTANIFRNPGGFNIRCASELEARQKYNTALDARQVQRVEYQLVRTVLSRQ